MSGYPVMLRLEGRSCVVVGGGQVAARKAGSLVEAGAQVTVVSPLLCGMLSELAAKGQVKIQVTNYVSGMLADLRPMLVFVATDNPDVNRQVAQDARAIGAWVNTVDDADNCDFTSMAAFRRGSITIAVSSDGASPGLSTHLKRRLEDAIGDEYAMLAEWMANARLDVRHSILGQPARQALWQAVIDSAILDYLRRGEVEAARTLFEMLIAEAGERTS